MTENNKILIIEDDLYILKIYTNKLKMNQFDVSFATTGEEGLHKASTEKPQLILLDLMLPGVDGFQVLADLKKKVDTHDIPVIILSNLGQQSDIERGKELGATDYLVKANLSLIHLVDKVKKYLSH
ncbi:MAG TPA: response regulator [Candidatus Kerfeldbacteria bacterium]|nr:MAG: Two component transcriptional regulator, winged helix family [Parcubacteria group bacterium GW2011_GWA2_48_9]KKW15925.1 MAG: Two component transcriptional regulator, winged helix family [Parcubacteria group bacterium GW2011_GWC2_49_9]HCJ52504.1 response regulator [Candidatus Kerfeldbacteria bacterium]HCM68498.1 response regulator [Candidatus Kerfeldbacteria bacterium]